MGSGAIWSPRVKLQSNELDSNKLQLNVYPKLICSLAWTKNPQLEVDLSLMVANDMSIPRECPKEGQTRGKQNYLNIFGFGFKPHPPVWTMFPENMLQTSYLNIIFIMFFFWEMYWGSAVNRIVIYTRVFF